MAPSKKRKAEANAGTSQAKRRIIPVDWSAADETLIQASLDVELRLWRRVRDLYQVNCFDIIPPGGLVSFGAIPPPGLEQMVNTNWNQRASLRFIFVLTLPIFEGRLDVLHYCISMANAKRIRYCARPVTRHLIPADPVWVGPFPEHVEGFTRMIQEAVQSHYRRYDFNTDITVFDLEVLPEAWDLYVESKPELGLKTTKEYQTAIRAPTGTEIVSREEVLEWKMDWILESRRHGRPCNQPSNRFYSTGVGVGDDGGDDGGDDVGDDDDMGGSGHAGLRAGDGSAKNVQNAFVISDDDESSNSTNEDHGNEGSSNGRSAGSQLPAGMDDADDESANIPEEPVRSGTQLPSASLRNLPVGIQGSPMHVSAASAVGVVGPVREGNPRVIGIKIRLLIHKRYSEKYTKEELVNVFIRDIGVHLSGEHDVLDLPIKI
ncbi:hypothetical protein DSL72_008898 [Monilinia vaccinii-corymbosi]|uniref:Uncharacterized protein n=1 Tax=Monilinia vaccinii-corymbosi TaxID=61207 RepID=A0A8A3PSF4_9HELO|nr:hypothetical protein DSL72_008898 [Monilinia vaccinii-corymbosi]